MASNFRWQISLSGIQRDAPTDQFESAMFAGQDFIGSDVCDHYAFRQKDVDGVTATVAVTSAEVGSIVRSVRPNCVPLNYGGMIHQQCGSAW